jgi:pimeloyl-ACP methyl ester carboxylesterase
MPDLRHDLRQVTTRVDVLAGERDAKFVELARELSSLLQGSRLTIVPDAGHNLLLEAPLACADLLTRGATP